MMLTLPQLELADSPLLQAATDEHHFRVWNYERDGAYPRHRAVKDEIERLVGEIERANTTEALFAAAESDRHFTEGSSLRGPRPYSREEGARPAAFRQLEMVVNEHRWALNVESLGPASREDRVCRAVPGLFDALNARDGLLALKPEMIPAGRNDDPYVLFGEHAVFAHPEIRGCRELTAHLWWLAANGSDVRVAIDPHRVVAREEARGITMLDYWYGITPTRGDLDDLSVVGHTRHERRADAHEQFGAYPLVATEFTWHAEGAHKILKVEETVPRSAHTGAGPVRNRFLHSIRDTFARRFIHLDAAVKGYELSGYEADLATPTAAKGANPLYRKMWRVEGPIEEAEWGRLVGHFFRGNELVIEYFGEALDERPA